MHTNQEFPWSCYRHCPQDPQGSGQTKISHRPNQTKVLNKLDLQCIATKRAMDVLLLSCGVSARHLGCIRSEREGHQV